MVTGDITELKNKYDGKIFLINNKYIGIVNGYNLIVQSLDDDNDKYYIKMFMKAHVIKQILLKDKCLQIESFSELIEQYNLI